VFARAKIFAHVFMAVFALGFAAPAPLCASTPVMTDCDSSCGCCADKYQPDKPCDHSCAMVQAPIPDKQTPARTALPTFAPSPVLLFSIIPAQFKNFALSPAIHRVDLTAAPPSSGCPPQALLCLWRV
jgi:hypothetical protein